MCVVFGEGLVRLSCIFAVNHNGSFVGDHLEKFIQSMCESVRKQVVPTLYQSMRSFYANDKGYRYSLFALYERKHDNKVGH